MEDQNALSFSGKITKYHNSYRKHKHEQRNDETSRQTFLYEIIDSEKCNFV